MLIEFATYCPPIRSKNYNLFRDIGLNNSYIFEIINKGNASTTNTGKILPNVEDALPLSEYSVSDINKAVKQSGQNASYVPIFYSNIAKVFDLYQD